MRVWSISPDVIFMGRGDDLGPWTLVCTCGHVCVREFICTHHLNSVIAPEPSSCRHCPPCFLSTNFALSGSICSTHPSSSSTRALSPFQVQVPRLPAAAAYVVLLPLILHLFLTPSLLPFPKAQGGERRCPGSQYKHRVECQTIRIRLAWACGVVC